MINFKLRDPDGIAVTLFGELNYIIETIAPYGMVHIKRNSKHWRSKDNESKIIDTEDSVIHEEPGLMIH